MSTAVVCAHLNLLNLTSPSVVPDSKSCSGCRNVASSSSAAFGSRRHQTYNGRIGYSSNLLVCRGASGGSRRDFQKIVARNQKRRSRHVKGVTPTTPDLLNQLESEKQDQEKLDAQDIDDEDYDEDDDFGSDEAEDDDIIAASDPLPEDEAAILPPEVAKASYVGDKFEGTSGDNGKRLGDQVEDTVANVAGKDNAKRLRKSGERVGEDLEDVREEGQESTEAVADVAGSAGDAAGKRLQKTGRRVGDNLEEVRKAGETALDEGADVVGKQADRAFDNIQEGVEEAGNTAQDLFGVAQAAAEDTGKRLRDAGDNIREDLEDIGQEGRKELQKGGRAVGKQARQGARQVDRQMRGVEQNAGQAVRTTIKGVQRSVDRVQDPINKAVNASIGAAAAIGNEVFRFGDTLLEAAEEATGMGGVGSSEPPERRSPSTSSEEGLVGGKYKPAGKGVSRRYQGVSGQGEEEDQEENGPFTDFKVLVAGATGRTGRLIVDNLVGKDVPVRALVRDVYRARNLKQLQGAELVEGDLYNYESVKEAIGDSNVVICAVGARGLPFDLLQYYRTEYEGVLNLISAAKNKGDVKKFILITTIGVNTFQVIPLLFWKRQAELFLQRSGLDYTIVRPAGLTGDRGRAQNVELRPADSQFMGAVSRRKVAEVCLSALVTPSASEKIVEVVGGSGRVKRSLADQFESV